MFVLGCIQSGSQFIRGIPQFLSRLSRNFCSLSGILFPCRDIFRAAGPLRAAMLLYMYKAGMRQHEVRQLRMDDVVSSRYIRIKDKGRKERMVPMTSTLHGALEVYFKALADLKNRSKLTWYNTLMFPSLRTGGLQTDVRRLLWRAIEKAGITQRVTPHILRPSFATHLCWRPIKICARSRSCQGMPMCPRPRSTSR